MLHQTRKDMSGVELTVNESILDSCTGLMQVSGSMGQVNAWIFTVFIKFVIPYWSSNAFIHQKSFFYILVLNGLELLLLKWSVKLNFLEVLYCSGDSFIGLLICYSIINIAKYMFIQLKDVYTAFNSCIFPLTVYVLWNKRFLSKSFIVDSLQFSFLMFRCQWILMYNLNCFCVGYQSAVGQITRSSKRNCVARQGKWNSHA